MLEYIEIVIKLLNMLCAVQPVAETAAAPLTQRRRPAAFRWITASADRPVPLRRTPSASTSSAQHSAHAYPDTRAKDRIQCVTLVSASTSRYNNRDHLNTF